jgi:hypothetical protein
MSRSKLEKVRIVFTSEYWLIASLCGAFFSFFALNRGGVVVFIEAGIVLLFINSISGEYRFKNIPIEYLITLAICAYLLGASVLFYPKTSHYRWMANMVRMLGVVFAIHCLTQKKMRDWITIFFFVVLSAAVCWQAVVHYVFQMPYGTFSNPHYLASFLMLALPVLAYSLIVTRGWYKFCFFPVILLDADLLLRIESRPAVFGIVVGTIFLLVFLTKGWRRWGSLLLLSAILVSLYITDYGNVYSRFEELIVNFSKEERLPLWRSAWDMLKDNNLTAWIVGHGIGAGRSVLPQYSPEVLKSLIFSHNYLLEICYENGIVGVTLLFGGIACLLISAVKTAKQTKNRNISNFIKSMIVVFISWLIHTGLTFPFYSKYSQYSLAFILGALLPVLRQPAMQKDRITHIK